MHKEIKSIYAVLSEKKQSVVLKKTIGSFSAAATMFEF